MRLRPLWVAACHPGRHGASVVADLGNVSRLLRRSAALAPNIEVTRT